MGVVYAEIELINGWELEASRRKLIDQGQVKRINVKAVATTGSSHLVINESIQEMLQLPVLGKRNFELADGTIISCDFVGPVETRFKNRRCTASAFVLPGNLKPLLGINLMREMDVIVDPKKQALILYPEQPLTQFIRI